jgi:hypothetical protein
MLQSILKWILFFALVGVVCMILSAVLVIAVKVFVFLVALSIVYYIFRRMGWTFQRYNR